MTSSSSRPLPWRELTSSDRAPRASLLVVFSNGRAAADLQIPPVSLPHGMDGLWGKKKGGVHLRALLAVALPVLLRLTASLFVSKSLPCSYHWLHEAMPQVARRAVGCRTVGL